MIVLARSDSGNVQLEVLTLAEAAAFLRVEEEALLTLAKDRAVPAQQIGGEWRFLKDALGDWLRYGPHYKSEIVRLSDEAAKLILVLEKRFGKPVEEPQPGSRQAVKKHFGVWKDDPTAETMLAEIYKRRESEGD